MNPVNIVSDNSVDAKKLAHKLINQLSDSSDSLEGIIESLSHDEKKAGIRLHLIEPLFWSNELKNCSDDILISCIKFFALSEMLIAQWHFSEKSPAIYCSKLFRKRKKRLPTELIVWLKKYSDNQFLPFGPL